MTVRGKLYWVIVCREDADLFLLAASKGSTVQKLLDLTFFMTTWEGNFLLTKFSLAINCQIVNMYGELLFIEDALASCNTHDFQAQQRHNEL